MKGGGKAQFVGLGLAGALLVAAALFAASSFWPGNRSPSAPASVPAKAVEAPAPAKPAASAATPSFDAVHVGKDGHLVVAGRAPPGAVVTLLDRGKPVGTVTADQNGEWVLTPDQPLAPGDAALSLTARAPDGRETGSNAAVAVLVPKRPAENPVAVLLQPGAAGAHALQPPGARPAHGVALDTVEYDESGSTILTGRAEPGAHIDVYVNGAHAGATVADAAGNWSLSKTDIPTGRYRLRVTAGGAAELALELRRAAPGELAPGDYLAVVPGNSLWHLARHSYGDGLRYVEIYRANRGSIADPNLIYPGQLLALPKPNQR